MIKASSLESKIIQVKKDNVGFEKLFADLKVAKIYVPSSVDPKGDLNKIAPLLFKYNDKYCISIFTSKEIASSFTSKISYLIEINFERFLSHISKDYGVIVNPGVEASFLIDEPSTVLKAL